MAIAHIRTLACFALVVSTFAGRLIDEGNSRALDGVRIHAEGVQSADTVTDKSGRFTLSNLKPGSYTVTAQSETVPVQEFHVTLPANRTTIMDMKVCSTQYDAHCGPPPRGLP